MVAVKIEVYNVQPPTLPISVVIPAYNRDWCISEAIQSVHSQTRRPAEIIVVDDGSVDRTGEIAAGLGAIVIRQANKKLPGARNTGILTSQQPWVAFLDTDDVWLPEKLERQWAALQACPTAGFCFTDLARFNANGVYLQSFFSSAPSYNTMQRSYIMPEAALCERATLVQHFVTGHFILLGSTLLVRRALLIRVGLFDETLVSWEDYEMMLRLMTVADGVSIERPLWRQRMHPGNYAHEELLLPTGEAMVGDRILAQPTRYPPYAVEYFQQHHAANLTRLGIQLLAAGRAKEAVDWFTKSRRLKPSIKTTFVLHVARAANGAGKKPFSILHNLWRMRKRLPLGKRLRLVR
jgi:glycosyltransferase involved in cell wall biosynthesis